jgi:hypothetical protein
MRGGNHMPYDLRLKSGFVLRNIPDDMPPDAPELKQIAQQRQAEIRQASPEHHARVEAQRAADAEQYDPTKGMNWGEKALANVGAGFSELGMGARDLFGDATDAEIEEKRAIDKHLADKTTGGGALQLAGEIAPTLAVPAGAFLRGAQGGARVLKGAMGMSRAAAPTAARMGAGAVAVDSALAGGASGALQPATEDESRLMNMGVGAGFGAALPLAFAAGKKGIQNFTAGGAAGRVAGDVQDAVGKANIPQALGDLQTYYPHGAQNVPLTSAAVLENPALARMERTSRTDVKEQPAWFDVDKRQAEESWKSVEAATGDAADLAKRQKDRGTNWDTNWAAAEKGAKPRIWAQRMGGLKNNLDQAAQSPEAVNPLVLNALKQVDDAVTHFGAEFSPAHLQQLRAQLNGRPSLQPQATALQSAPRENKAIRSLITELDDILNASTGNKWDRVKQGYADDSTKVQASKAAKLVREKFVDEGTGRVQGSGSKFGSDLPEVTPAGIGRAMDAARKPDKSLALTSDANTRLMNLQEALRKQAITQGVARTAAPGGGSNTVGDAAGAAAQRAIPSMTADVIGAITGAAKNFGQRKYNEQLAKALRDPAEMEQMLSRKLSRDVPLTETEKMLLNALRGGTGGLGAERTSEFQRRTPVTQ